MISIISGYTTRCSQFLTACLLLTVSLSATAATDLQGKAVKFSDYIGKGKWTVFEVWSSDCPACPDAVFYMNNLKRRYDKAELIGISVNGDYGNEGPQMAKDFIKQHKISFPTIYSSSKEVDAFLGQYSEALFGTPSVLFFNPEGELRNIEVGAIISQDVIDFIEYDESNNR